MKILKIDYLWKIFNIFQVFFIANFVQHEISVRFIVHIVR
jgi:hypothetical protein